MKKFLIVALAAIALVSCNSKGEKSEKDLKIDSLEQANSQLRSEWSDLMETQALIESGFEDITEAEDTLNILQKEGVSNNRERIVKMIAQIQKTMNLNRERIEELEEQLKQARQAEPAVRRQMEERIEFFQKQLDQKQTTIDALLKEIKSKDATISAQAERIVDLNTNVAELHSRNTELNTRNTELTQRNTELNAQNQAKDATIAENRKDIAQKAQTINAQDQALNTAYYVFGTKSELKKQRILKNGDVLRTGDFNQNYFTKIDLRVTRVIKLYSKRAELKTSHPADSYTLAKDEQGQYVLRINNPERFWSTSRYLIIVVK